MYKYKRVRRHIEKPHVAQRCIITWDDKRIEREYKKCHELEKKLQKKYKAQIKTHTRIQPIYSLSNMQWIVDHLCDQLACRKTKVVQLPPEDYRECSHYDGKHIVMSCFGFYERQVAILLHELAHHIVRKENLIADSRMSRYHDEDYLWVLEMLYQMWYESF